MTQLNRFQQVLAWARTNIKQRRTSRSVELARVASTKHVTNHARNSQIPTGRSPNVILMYLTTTVVGLVEISDSSRIILRANKMVSTLDALVDTCDIGTAVPIILHI
jgi:hypothetical protein